MLIVQISLRWASQRSGGPLCIRGHTSGAGSNALSGERRELRIEVLAHGRGSSLVLVVMTQSSVIVSTEAGQSRAASSNAATAARAATVMEGGSRSNCPLMMAPS